MEESAAEESVIGGDEEPGVADVEEEADVGEVEVPVEDASATEMVAVAPGKIGIKEQLRRLEAERNEIMGSIARYTTALQLSGKIQSSYTKFNTKLVMRAYEETSHLIPGGDVPPEKWAEASRERTEAIADYIARNSVPERMTMDPAGEIERMKAVVRDALSNVTFWNQYSSQFKAQKASLRKQRKSLKRSERKIFDEEIARVEEGQEYLELLGDLMVPTVEMSKAKVEQYSKYLNERLSTVMPQDFASPQWLKFRINVLRNRLGVVDALILLAQGQRVDIRREKGLRKMLEQVIPHIPDAIAMDQYYNISTGKFVLGGTSRKTRDAKTKMYYDHTFHLAHIKLGELKFIVEVLHKLRIIPETTGEIQGITYIEEGGHRKAVIPPQIYHQAFGKGRTGVIKMRTDSKRYRTLVSTLSGRPEVRVLTAKEIKHALADAAKRDVSSAVQDEIASSRMSLSAIRVATLPITTVVEVPIEDIDTGVLEPVVDVSEPSVVQYVDYAEASSKKDQELASMMSAQFEGQYYRNSLDGTYVRREILDVLQERPVFTRTAGSSIPLVFARGRNGLYVPLPETFSKIVFNTQQRMRVAVDDSGASTMFQYVTGKTSRSQALRIVQKAMDAIMKLSPTDKKAIRKIIERASITTASELGSDPGGAVVAIRRIRQAGEMQMSVASLLTQFATQIQIRESRIQHIQTIYQNTLRRAEQLAERDACEGVMVTYGDGSQACMANAQDLDMTRFDGDLYVQVNGTEYYVSVYSDEYSDLLERAVTVAGIDRTGRTVQDVFQHMSEYGAGPAGASVFEIGAYGGLKVYNRYKIITNRTKKPIEYIPRTADGSEFPGFTG